MHRIVQATHSCYVSIRVHACLHQPAQVGIGGVVKLADFDELGRLGGARERCADGCSAPEVLRKVPPPPPPPCGNKATATV